MPTHENSVCKKILDVFAEGPGTVDDFVLELGVTANRVTGTLCYLVKTKKLTRRPFYLPPEMKRSGKDKVFLYSLRSYEKKAA